VGDELVSVAQDVGNALRVLPDGPVTREIANQVGGDHSGVAVDGQILIALAHIAEQLGIMKNVDARLVVKQNSASRNATAFGLHVHRGSCGMLLHKLYTIKEVHVAVLKLAFHYPFGDESSGVLLCGAVLFGLFFGRIVGHVPLSATIEACDFRAVTSLRLLLHTSLG
jgi:hypothetical protein